MKIKLLGVTKALEDKVPQEPGSQCLNLSHLFPTLETDEEISRGFAKLYTRRVSKLRPSSLSYEKTRMVVALTKDSAKREGLKEALGVSGWQLHSEEEWAKDIREAEETGRRELTLDAGPV